MDFSPAWFNSSMSGIVRPATCWSVALFAEGVWCTCLAPFWAHAIGKTRAAMKAFVKRTPA
jgi:hypothetical protein